MTPFLRFAGAVILILLSQATKAESLAKYLECFSAMAGSTGGGQRISKGAGIYSASDVLVPRGDISVRGTYVFKNSTAYFCELPKIGSGSVRSTVLRFVGSGGKVEEIYLSYLFYGKYKTQVQIKLEHPEAQEQSQFVESKCRSYLTEESRQALRSEVEGRVMSAYETYQFEDMGEGKNLADDYKLALQVCRQVSPRLAELVDRELAEFNSDKSGAKKQARVKKSK